MIRGSRRWGGGAVLTALAAMLLLTFASAQSTLSQLRAEVAAKPASVSAWVALGNALYKEGEHDEARDSYLEAIALDYGSGDAHYGLGLAQYSRGDYQAALFEFTEVTRLYPERFDGHFNRAVTLAKLRRPGEAASSFRAAIDSDDRNATGEDLVRAQVGLAGQLEQIGEWSEVAEAYAAALGHDPLNSDYILRRGRALLQAGDGLTALPELTALESESGDYRVSALVSDIYVANGQIDYGIWALERALSKAEAASDATAQASTLVKLGTLLRSLGRDAEATEAFELATQADPNYFEAQYNLGVSYLEGGQTRASLAPLEKAQALSPDRAEVYLALASANDLVGEHGVALTNAEQAAQRLNDDELVTEARFIAGRALYRTGDYAAASTELDQVLDARPTDGEAQLWRGLAAYQLGDYGVAVRHFERAVQINPGNVESRVNLGAGYLAAKQYADAQSVYELLVNQNPNDTESLYNLGWAFYSQDRRSSARDAWVSSCELGFEAACTAITTYL